MKLVLIGGVVAGLLIAVVLLVFRPDSTDDLGRPVADSAAAAVDDIVEIVPENPDPDNPGSDFSGSGQSPFEGITQGGIDPDFLIRQLEMAGVEIPAGASTQELADLLDEAVRDGGFIGFAP